MPQRRKRKRSVTGSEVDPQPLALPDELLLLVLCFVEPMDLTNMALVCRRFAALCTEESIWKAKVASSLSMPDSAESVWRKPGWQSWRRRLLACAVPPCVLVQAPDGLLPTELSNDWLWAGVAFKDSLVFIPAADNRVLVYEMIGSDLWLLHRTLVLDDGTCAGDCSVVGQYLLVRFDKGHTRRGVVAFDASLCRCGTLVEDYDGDHYALNIVPLGDKLVTFHGPDQGVPAWVENVSVVRLDFAVVDSMVSVGNERVAFIGRDLTGFPLAGDDLGLPPPSVYQIDGRLEAPARLDAKPGFPDSAFVCVGVSGRLLLISYDFSDGLVAAVEALSVDDASRTVVTLESAFHSSDSTILSSNDLLFVILTSGMAGDPSPYTVLCFSRNAELLWRLGRSSAEFWPDIIVDGWQSVQPRPKLFEASFLVLPDGSLVCCASHTLMAQRVSRLVALRHGC
eukprot:TRINITY_DN2345_c1_g1_i1.p1 TRINITY_DN2345_c1_g1~~TRINITY_DN2345_c1_g1_i1.p1  ORF type:complete len:512 (+),score=26.81 TRINITY_DN2345_c1_g1_i1:179-1537(+)